MARRLPLLLLALALVVAAPASGDIGSRKAAVDAKIERLHARIAAAQAKAASLQSEIAGVTTQIHVLEHQVGVIAARLAPLEHDLALHQQRLAKLNQLFELETKQLVFLEGQYHAAVDRLNARVVEIYESEQPTTLDVVLESKSFQDLLDTLDYLSAITKQDKRIAEQVHEAKVQMHDARERTKTVRNGVAAETRVIESRASQVEAVRDRLIASGYKLAGARAQKRHALAVTEETKRSYLDEADALSKVSAELAAKIQAAQAQSRGSSTSSDTTPSAAGLVWPVSGPVTSPFGMRWGRMHEGIDIGVPSGTPIHAAAAGHVIYCGWMSGYGNLVVLDHGNGIATAYAHQSSIAVGCGQDVAQGEVIGYVGCTGHCFGPHLHFEVRVNGAAVDPLGYL